MGQLANDVRQSLEGFIAQKQAQLKSALMEQKLKKENAGRYHARKAAGDGSTSSAEYSS